MSQYSQSSTASFEEYTTGLRNGLREAARMGLSQLEEMINEVGYGWLDGYMESIMESSSSKAPIADLMKTPSRTQKPRSTRAKTATAKARSKKAAKANQALGKSVSGPSPLARQALSPLNPSNSNTPPPAGLSPSKGKTKAGKNAKPAKEKKAKEKAGPSKKSRQKKAEEPAEVDPDAEPDVVMRDTVMDERANEVDIGDLNEAVQPRDIPQLDSSTVDQSSEALVEAVPVNSPARPGSQQAAVSQASKQSAKQKEPPAENNDIRELVEEHAVEKDEDVAEIDEPEEAEIPDSLDARAPIVQHAGAASLPELTEGGTEEAAFTIDPSEAQDDMTMDTLKAEIPATSTIATDLELDLPAPSISSPPLPTPLAENNTLPFQFPDFKVAPTPAPRDPSVPVRQVRSSWLSKVIGSNTVPVTAPVASSSNDPANIRRSIIDANSRRSVMAQPEGLRKSVVIPPRERFSTLPSAPIDFAAARKSLVQPGQLGTKRKSEILEENREAKEEQPRPEKVSKPNSTATSDPSAPIPVAPAPAAPKTESLFSPPEVQPRRITPFGRPKVSTASTQTFPLPTTTPHHPTQASLSSAHRDTTQARTDIDKVTRALDELRERAAAKEASKAKLAASGTKVSFDSRSSTSTQAQPQSSGGGFFRGLGSLGRSLGLGGSAKSAEDEALRLQRELEEERRAEKEAEAELKRLMDEVATEEPDKAAPWLAEVPAELKTQEQDVDMPGNGTDDEDADSVNADLTVEMDEPPVLTATDHTAFPAREATPPRSQVPVTTSTTPTATPPPSMPSILQRLGSNAPPQPPRSTVKPSRVEVAIPTTKPMAVRPKSPRSQQLASQHSKPSQNGALSPRSPGSRPVSRLAQAAPPRPPKSPERTKRVPLPTSPTSSKSPGQSLRTTVKSPPRKPVESQAAAEPKPTPILEASKAKDEAEHEQDEDSEDDSEADIELPDLPEPSEPADESDVDMDDEAAKSDREVPAAKMFKGDTSVAQDGVKLKKSSSSQSIAPSLATSTASSSNMLSHASTIAGKTLGFKPTTGPVKSIALAAAAAKKEQAAIDRKAQFRAEAEQRKAQAAQKKAEEDRQKVEEEKRIRAAELEEKRKHRAALEKQRKEREEKVAAIAEEKVKRKAEEAAAAAKIKAEQEANRKRKLLQAGQKSGAPPAKKPAPAPAASAVAPVVQAASLPPKNHQPLRVIKPSVVPSGSSTLGPAQKLGPTHFRSASSSNPDTGLAQSASTVSVAQTNGERQPLGPPSRPSTQIGPAQHSTHSSQVQSNVASAVLQQSRLALQTQIDIKALEKESEDIELPDIASEYSDSEDEDKSTDFIRPAWAESPELRQALQQQAYRDPGDLFGPIKPVNMQELFKAPAGKFRARSSSANWISTGDRLTSAEETEYARRMGFKPIAPLARADGSSGTGTNGARSSQA